MPCGRVYELFRSRQRGAWQRIFTRCQSQDDATGPITWEFHVGSTVFPAHRPTGALPEHGKGGLQKDPPVAPPLGRTITGADARAVA